MSMLCIGTCSWKYPSWAGLVYSEPKGINYLLEYARQYSTVEIDQWFWSLMGDGRILLPKSKDVEEYAAAVPDDFRFTVKAPNSITLTHPYGQRAGSPPAANPSFLSEEIMRDFCQRLEPIREKLGMVFFQFEYLNRQKMTSQQQFQQLVQKYRSRLPEGIAYGLEIRNSSWLNTDFFEFLLDAKLSPVLLQGYWMPPLTEVYEKHRARILKHPVVVMRLMGADRQGIEKEAEGSWDKILWSKEEEINAITGIIRDILAAGVDLYVNINNHYEGSAPRSIARLLDKLEIV